VPGRKGKAAAFTFFGNNVGVSHKRPGTPDAGFNGQAQPRAQQESPARLVGFPAQVFVFAGCPGDKKSEWHGNAYRRHTIGNKMPGFVDFPSDVPSEYYIYKGVRHELTEFDTQWVKNNCSLEVQEVY
jgi:hypothetical protein